MVDKMNFKSVYSSIVLVGKDFTPHLFNSSEFLMLGEVEKETQVLLPIFLQQYYPESKYKISITPDRIDIAYLSNDILPENLKKIANSIKKKLKGYQANFCNGIGINCDVVISESVLGMTGKSYCLKNYFNLKNIEKKIGKYEEFVNTTKLIYTVSDVRYTIDIEPYFKAKGKDLMIKLNAHQSIQDNMELDSALKKFNTIKQYILSFHDNFLGE